MVIALIHGFIWVEAKKLKHCLANRLSKDDYITLFSLFRLKHLTSALVYVPQQQQQQQINTLTSLMEQSAVLIFNDDD